MLDRINNRVYGSDKQQAIRSALSNIELMLRYKVVFKHIRNGENYLKAVTDMSAYYQRENTLTDKQLSYINNGLIEKFWTGMSKLKNDPAIAGITGTKHDNKKVIRYG